MEANSNAENQKRQKIRVQMLGEFKIFIGSKEFTNRTLMTKQVENLIGYLIAYRTKVISHDELVEVLWPDGSSERPSNALKNLVYRARNTLANQEFPYAKEIIVFEHGCYSWNNMIPCEVDIEVFERLSKTALDDTLNAQEKIDRYLHAIALYKGDFLPHSCYQDWVIHLSQYYHSTYLKCVYEAVELLEEQGQYGEVKSICEKAICVDRLEETLHRHLLYAMYKMNTITTGLSYYHRISKMFYTELGIKLSTETQNVYHLLLKSTQNDEQDLMHIKKGLLEPRATGGAYFCEYEIFKCIYQQCMRDIRRSNEDVYIGLFTVIDNNGKIPDSKQVNRVMQKFLEVITENLRASDVVSRYSLTQFVIMMPRITKENAQQVMKRLVNKFDQTKPNLKVKIILTTEPIDE